MLHAANAAAVDIPAAPIPAVLRTALREKTDFSGRVSLTFLSVITSPYFCFVYRITHSYEECSG